MTTLNAALESPIADAAVEATVELGGDLLVKQGLSRNGLIVLGAIAGTALVAGVGYWGFKKFRARREELQEAAADARAAVEVAEFETVTKPVTELEKLALRGEKIANKK